MVSVPETKTKTRFYPWILRSQRNRWQQAGVFLLSLDELKLKRKQDEFIFFLLLSHSAICRYDSPASCCTTGDRVTEKTGGSQTNLLSNELDSIFILHPTLYQGERHQNRSSAGRTTFLFSDRSLTTWSCTWKAQGRAETTEPRRSGAEMFITLG